METKAKVYYFKVWGLAEYLRMILWYAKIPYENVFCPHPWKQPEKWAAMKPQFQFGNVPAVEIDGKTLVQSGAIQNYIARNSGLIPQDNYQKYLAESIEELLMDIFRAQAIVYFSPPEEKLEASKKFVTETLDSKLTYVEDRLKANETQDFLVGNSLTIPDIKFMSTYYSSWQDPNEKPEISLIFKEVLNKHPLFVEYVGKVRKLFDEYFDEFRFEPEKYD